MRERAEWLKRGRSRNSTKPPKMGGESLYFGKPSRRRSTTLPGNDCSRSTDTPPNDQHPCAIGDGNPVRMLQGGNGREHRPPHVSSPAGWRAKRRGNDGQPDPPKLARLLTRCGDGADLIPSGCCVEPPKGFARAWRIEHRRRPAPRHPHFHRRGPKPARNIVAEFYDVFAFYYFLHCRTPPRWRRRAPRCRRLKPCSTTS